MNLPWSKKYDFQQIYPKIVVWCCLRRITMNAWVKLVLVAGMAGLAGVAGCGRGQEQAAAPAADAATDAYPIDTCVVSGAKLGSMGDPVEVEHEGRRVLLCCAGCVGAFEADPERYLAILDDAATPESSSVPHDHGAHGPDAH
jgi:hypothetical protein